MPVLRYVFPDMVETVIPGELFRSTEFNPQKAAFGVAPILLPPVQGDGTPLAQHLVPDEDEYLPMNSFFENNRLSARRSDIPYPRTNAGISTPCGVWVPTITDRLPANRNGGYEQYFLTGVTRDGAGAALGNCTVKIFRTENDTKMLELTSDGSGNWSVQISEPGPFYYVCYKTGSPDFAGTSVNTNVPAKVN